MISPKCGICKKDTNEVICRAETDSLTLKNLWLPKGIGRVRGRDRLGVLDWHMHTEVYGMTDEWGPAV